MPQIASSHFTPRMAALLDAALPDTRATARTRFLADVLYAVENRAPMSSQHYAKAEQWGMQGTFGKAYDALHAHAAELDHDERIQLWSLKGLHEVYRSGAPPTFERAVDGLGIWKVGNVRQMQVELASPMPRDDASASDASAAAHADRLDAMEVAGQEDRIDDFVAELCFELGLSGIPGLTGGYGSSDHRLNMAHHLAQACRQIGLTTVTHIQRFTEVNPVENRERIVVGAWNEREPARRAFVDIDRMFVPAQATPDLVPTHVAEATVDSPAALLSPLGPPDLLRDL